MRCGMIILLSFLCAACSSPPWPSDVRIITMQTPYDLAYQRLESGMRHCSVPPKQRIDSQIYPTQHYAQITSYKTDGAGEKPEIMARLSPQGRATRMKLNVITAKNRTGAVAWMVHWAQGGQSCPPNGTGL